jgi:glycine C-acetyltransferase
MKNSLISMLTDKLSVLKEEGRLKGKEKIITDVLPPYDGFGSKVRISDGPTLLNFASNSYLGIAKDMRLIHAEHEASMKYGVGPGAVRFISGSQKPHTDLEKRLASFFRKESSMIFSSAYAANCGIIAPLIDENTIVISDELNHNSIIMAIRLSHVPRERKKIYGHCNVSRLKQCITESIGNAKRVLVVTDGIFSMRGNYAPLKEIAGLCAEYSPKFDEGIITVVDDSHGIGAFGKTGRGTVEICDAYGIDIITGTLGKALGVDGGFIVSDKIVVEYLRETSPFYIYSNPVSAGVASASLKALEILDSSEGQSLLEKLTGNAEYFRSKIEGIGYRTIEGIHPIVPLVIGDPKKAKRIASQLYENGIFVIALTFPVVPRGQDTIRVQISASQTKKDIDYAIEAFKKAGKEEGIIN